MTPNASNTPAVSCAKWYAASSGYVRNRSSTFTFLLPFLSSRLRIECDAYVWLVRRTHRHSSALQLPMPRGKGKRSASIGNAYASGVPKRNDTGRCDRGITGTVSRTFYTSHKNLFQEFPLRRFESSFTHQRKLQLKPGQVALLEVMKKLN